MDALATVDGGGEGDGGVCTKRLVRFVSLGVTTALAAVVASLSALWLTKKAGNELGPDDESCSMLQL